MIGPDAKAGTADRSTSRPRAARIREDRADHPTEHSAVGHAHPAHDRTARAYPGPAELISLSCGYWI